MEHGVESIGETRWMVLKPGWGSIVQGRGSCFSATRRTFFAALWTAFRNSELTCALAARISFSEIQTPVRERSSSSNSLVHENKAESPRLRTSATIVAATE